MKWKLFTVFFVAIFLLLAVSKITFAQAVFDTVSIHDLQFVANPSTNDTSSFFGDTVVVKGLVMNGPRDIWVNNRWAVFVVDPDNPTDPWNGFFVLQDDTLSAGGQQTGFQFVEPGWIVYFTGVVSEFEQFTQINTYSSSFTPDPVIQVGIVSIGNPLPDPVLLTAADLTGALSEQWESMFVRVENATVVNNAVPTDWASIRDATDSLTFMAEYFNWFRDRLPVQGDGSYNWPSQGSQLSVQGFVREESGTGLGQVFDINPRDTSDLEVSAAPPNITNVTRNPGVPTSSNTVQVNATITDVDGNIANADLLYSVNEGPWQSLDMFFFGSNYFATIPSQSDGDFVRYFIFAEDNDMNSVTVPQDTSEQVFFYVIRDAGLSIKDVQYNWGYSNTSSGFEGFVVTLDGVVMTDPTDFLGYYYIQEKDSMWSGILVNSPQPFNKGDWVEVTGTVDEDIFGSVTKIANVTSENLVTANFGAFDPVVVTAGEINNTGDNNEAYESVFVRVENLTVSDPFPDSPSNFGSFEVSDGADTLVVEDDFFFDNRSAFQGNLDSTFGLGDQIEAIQGMGYYLSLAGSYELLPRDSSDIIGHVPVGIADNKNPIPLSFELSQNYPNPFNPTTEIKYGIASSGRFGVKIYNILGQKVRTLINTYHSAGNYKVQWDGRDDHSKRVGSGIYFYTLNGENVSLTKKMILLK